MYGSSYCVVSLITYLQISCSSQSFTQGVKHVGYTVGSSNSTILSTPSDYECIFRCYVTTDCIVMGYSGNTCTLLYRAIPTFKLSENQDDIFFLIGEIPAMIVTKIKSYQHTFNEANGACAQINARLLTPSELYNLFSDGFQVCNCAWVSDGHSKYIMQEVKPGCGSRIGVVTCTYMTGRWNVWCKLL